MANRGVSLDPQHEIHCIKDLEIKGSSKLPRVCRGNDHEELDPKPQLRRNIEYYNQGSMDMISYVQSLFDQGHENPLTSQPSRQ
jgi:hypothetical protein